MNASNDAARQQQQAEVARTGTNSAALANEVGSQARAGQRQLTDYNATRNTENEGKWLGEQQNLFGDEAKGADMEEGLYGTSVGAQDSTLGTAQIGEDEQEQSTNQMIDAGVGAAGAAAGGFSMGAGSAPESESIEGASSEDIGDPDSPYQGADEEDFNTSGY